MNWWLGRGHGHDGVWLVTAATGYNNSRSEIMPLSVLDHVVAGVGKHGQAGPERLNIMHKRASS
jgi:hypothetical protein